MSRLIDADKPLSEAFRFTWPVQLEDPVLVECKHPGCKRRWLLELTQDEQTNGAIDTGSRNSLLSHAEAHAGRGVKLRRA